MRFSRHRVKQAKREERKKKRAVEKYSDENEIRVNERKTKIMMFRKGGRKGKEKWEFLGKKLEIVGEYKYLGFWFTTGNSYALHINKMAAKVNKVINAVWGVWKRAKIRTLKDRLYLMDAIVKAGCFYGVEIWGWATWELRLKQIYSKLQMGDGSGKG